MQKHREFFAAEDDIERPERKKTVPSSPQKVRGKFFIAIIALTVIAGSFVAGTGVFFFYRLYLTLPTLGQMQNIQQPLVSKVLSKDGELIHEFSIERRYYVPLDSIAPQLQEAVIAIEDRRYYKHWGIDLRRIFGAVVVDLARGHYAQGASTLTQQLARNVYLTARSSLIRKLREVLTAIQLESCYTKNEILELYLNQVYLGAGVYGVQAASQYYFNKPASRLSLNECATLAGLIQLPERYRPDKEENLQRMTDRRNKVLAAMRSMKKIDKALYRETAALPIVTDLQRKTGGNGSYFVEMVRRYVSDNYGDNQLYNGGLTIHTTLDPVAQDSSERSCGRQIMSLQERLNRIFLDSTHAERQLKISRDFFEKHFDSVYAANKERFKDLPDSVKLRQAQISVIALDVATGAIRVLIGGRNFTESKFNRALHARRQPGSSFKAFVYAAAMDNGYTPATVVLDQPITLVTSDGEWRPENYDKVFNGPITIRKAVAKSVNLVAIQVLNKVGPQVVIDYARRMGLKHSMKPVPALAIGACEATPMEMTSAYSAFPNHGIRETPYHIEKIVDKNGRVLETHQAHEEEVLSEQTAYLMCSLLRSVVCCGTGAKIPGLGFTYPAGGKTGTTNDYSDAWFIGFTQQIACGVWTGVDERRSLGAGVTGSLAAIPVWVRTMIPLHRDLKKIEFRRPETGIKTEMICDESHLLATRNCPKPVAEVFKSDAVLDTCDIHGSGKKTGSSNIIRLFSAPKSQKSKNATQKKRPLMF
ncbi:MAG: PBP1A family penicillin-binding protein [Chitinispirillaceae bacterium]|nr:PBP1A family penicillin-binding protein [Chitinispirillaceae bacterium]